jgi:hypothetical protein
MQDLELTPLRAVIANAGRLVNPCSLSCNALVYLPIDPTKGSGE